MTTNLVKLNTHKLISIKTQEENNDLKKKLLSSYKPYIKHISLCLLVLQSAVHVMVLRFSRVGTGDMYFASTAVFFSELLKLWLCLIVTFFESGTFESWILCLRAHVFNDLVYTLKLCVPAFLFVIQNNLQYVSLSNLDPTTFQAIYQGKILVTAFFSVILLKKSFQKKQWLALVFLCFGLILVQLEPSQIYSLISRLNNQSLVVGMFSVLMSSITSGFGCVYFEKILKESRFVSISLLNIQLGTIGTLLSFTTMMFSDGIKISEHGMLFGYTKFVWFAILLQAVGGLLVAVVMKYADNILKCFAIAFSIILSCICSIYVFNFVLSIQFMLGISAVLLATYAYIPCE